MKHELLDRLAKNAGFTPLERIVLIGEEAQKKVMEHPETATPAEISASLKQLFLADPDPFLSTPS